MKYIFLTCLFAYALTVSGQDEDTLLEEIKMMAGLHADLSSMSPTEADALTRNQIRLSHFYSTPAADSLTITPRHQTVLHLSRSEAVFGAGFNLGGELYANDGRVDRRRSGLRLGFERPALLDRLEERRAPELTAVREGYLKELEDLSPRVNNAARAILFEKYLAVTNSEAYQQTYRDLMARTDSLVAVPARKLSVVQQDLLAQRQRLEAFTATYRSLLGDVAEMPAELRRNARHVVDSCRSLALANGEERFREQLLRSSGTPLMQKLLLVSRGFAVGNTALGRDDITSAGLPVRGVRYEYDNRGLRLGVQHGRRILSDRFVPRDGIVFHDLQRPLRLSRVVAGVRSGASGDYEVSALLARELPDEDNRSFFPRTNRVFGVATATGLTEKLSLRTGGYYSSTLQSTNGGDVPFPTTDIGGQTALRLALEMNADQLRVTAGLFRNGAFFRSFANPYLFTDYEGTELSAKINLWKGRVTGDFQLMVGRGTRAITRANVRYQARGQVRAQLGRATSVGLSAAPNVYRYEITDLEGFSQSNIYRADIQHRYELATRRNLVTTISLTNLDQGWAWNDTTAVTTAAILRATVRADVSESLSVSGDVLRNLGSDAAEWFHALAVTRDGALRWTAGLRYDKHRHELRGAPGAAIDLSFPLGPHLSANLNVYFRAGSAAGPNELAGQQHWQADF